VITFDDYAAKVRDLVDGTAQKKGYNDTGAEGKNQLMDFVETHCPGHGLGEIIYKAVRYGRKLNDEDLLKIGAWAFLLYRRHFDMSPVSRTEVGRIDHGPSGDAG